jgi:uncharacterized membrane protein
MSYLQLMRRVARSAATGALLTFLAGLLVFVLGSQTVAIRAYLEPGVVLAELVSPFLPSGVAYWVEPEGGPLGFLLIILVCAFFFWSALLGGMHYFLKRRTATTV